MAQAAVIDKCDLCEAEENVDFFCADCDEILCLSCKVSHSKSRATKNHKIIPLSQARDENIVHTSTIVYCSKHSTTEITLFCIKCDQLICTQCFIKEHNGHNVVELDQIRDSRAEELNKLIKTLNEKKVAYENVFQAEGQGHSQFLQSLDQAEKDISDQKAKIIEELNAVCEEQFSELKRLRQDEEKRYSAVCNKYQTQSQTVTSTIQTAQNSIASKNAAVIIQATVSTTDVLQGLEDPTMPLGTIATYQPGDRSRPTVRGVQGKVNIEHTTTTHQPDKTRHQIGDRSYSAISEVPTEQQGAIPKLKKDVHTEKLQEQKTSGDNKQQSHSVNKPRINVDKVKVKSTITVKDKSAIHVIVPLRNKTAWVKAAGEKKLLLIDSEGKIITKSVTLGNIYDAKEYRDELLVTCSDQYKVTKLTADGQLTSTFSNLSPYQPRGLCVTQDLEIMVCLRSSKHQYKNRVVRLNSGGAIIQTIQYKVTGAPLFKDPWRVTSLTTGEVIIKDLSEPSRIVGVDSEGQHLFTWEGEVQGMKLDKYSVHNITHDSNNHVFVTDYYNNRLYVLGKDGSEAMCLLDRKQGICGPQPVEVDNEGQLWVGCYDGKIHIIQY